MAKKAKFITAKAKVEESNEERISKTFTKRAFLIASIGKLNSSLLL